MFAKKFAVAVLVVVGLSGCALTPGKSSPVEEQVPEEIKNIRVMLARNTQAYEWFVEEGDYYDPAGLEKIAKEAKKKGETVNFTRRFPKLSNPSMATIAISNLVTKNFENDLTENGLKVVRTPCNSCLRVKIDFAHHEGEVTKFIFFVPVTQKAIYLYARARVFSPQGKLVFETSDKPVAESFIGLLESKAHREEITAAELAHYVAKELLGLIAKTRQQLLAAQQ